VYDRVYKKVVLYERVAAGTEILPEIMLDLDSPKLLERLGQERLEQLCEDIELLDEAGDEWNVDDFLAGDVTPFFFGSAMTNFGVQPILDAIANYAPSPTSRKTTEGIQVPTDKQFTGFIFKIQANMNPRHRDRIAFMRVVSGKFERGMDVNIARTQKKIRLSKPHTFMAAERSIVDDAQPGDIVGLYDPGELRIGDTLSNGQAVEFLGIPRFAPEHFTRVILKDPTRRKQLQQGLEQLSLEGSIQLFYREGLGKADPYLGAVGLLQFEVLQVRLLNEYRVKADLMPLSYTVARWVTGAPEGLEWLKARPDYLLVSDRDDHPVLLSETPWPLTYALSEAPGLELLDISPL
jgi:peptide chain release factor 3